MADSHRLQSPVSLWYRDLESTKTSVPPHSVNKGMVTDVCDMWRENEKKFGAV